MRCQVSVIVSLLLLVAALLLVGATAASATSTTTLSKLIDRRNKYYMLLANNYSFHYVFGYNTTNSLGAKELVEVDCRIAIVYPNHDRFVGSKVLPVMSAECDSELPATVGGWRLMTLEQLFRFLIDATEAASAEKPSAVNVRFNHYDSYSFLPFMLLWTDDSGELMLTQRVTAFYVETINARLGNAMDLVNQAEENFNRTLYAKAATKTAPAPYYFELMARQHMQPDDKDAVTNVYVASSGNVSNAIDIKSAAFLRRVGVPFFINMNVSMMAHFQMLRIIIAITNASHYKAEFDPKTGAILYYRFQQNTYLGPRGSITFAFAELTFNKEHDGTSTIIAAGQVAAVVLCITAAVAAALIIGWKKLKFREAERTAARRVAASEAHRSNRDDVDDLDLHNTSMSETEEATINNSDSNQRAKPTKHDLSRSSTHRGDTAAAAVNAPLPPTSPREGKDE